jgi:hypothetical protein
MASKFTNTLAPIRKVLRCLLEHKPQLTGTQAMAYLAGLILQETTGFAKAGVFERRGAEGDGDPGGEFLPGRQRSASGRGRGAG